MENSEYNYGYNISLYTPQGADIWNDFKYLLEEGIRIASIESPFFGLIFGPMLSLFFPDKSEKVRWEELIKQIEALIDQKIDAAVLSLMLSEVSALGQLAKKFKITVEKGSPESIRSEFINLDNEFEGLTTKLQNPDYSWLLLPLYAISANMHGSLMRVCILESESWEWVPADIELHKLKFAEKFDEYDKYMTAEINKKIEKARKDAPPIDKKNVNVYRYMAPIYQFATEKVDDFRILLNFLNPIKYPSTSVDIPLESFADVYSGPYGSAAGNSVVERYYEHPLADMMQISLADGMNGQPSRPSQCSILYPSGKGPLLFGDSGKRVDSIQVAAKEPVTNSRTVKLPPPPAKHKFSIKKIIIKSGDVIEGLWLCPDETTKIQLWDVNKPNAPLEFSVELRRLSTIHIAAQSSFYHDAISCLIFGFGRDSLEENKQVKKLWYIMLKNERQDLITVTPELVAKRAEYQALQYKK